MVGGRDSYSRTACGPNNAAKGICLNPRWIEVNDKIQQNYAYLPTEPKGANFPADFSSELTPREMLELGVFGGKYMADCTGEFPSDWFKNAKVCSEKHNSKLNFFGVNASQPLAVWRKKAGSTLKVLTVGFSGIADTLSVEDVWMTKGR